MLGDSGKRKGRSGHNRRTQLPHAYEEQAQWGEKGCTVNVLDVLLLLAVLVFAVSGYQRGLVAGFVSLAGFVGGAVVGVWLLPSILEKVPPGTTEATVAALLTVLVPAAVGQALAAPIGWRLRGALSWTPVRWADGAGGVVVNAIAVLVVGWVAASALSVSPSPALNQSIRGSAVLGQVQDRMPAQASTWFNDASGALTTAGFPPVFNPFENEPGAAVAKPSGDSVTASATQAAKRSTVKVEGVADVDGEPARPGRQWLRLHEPARDDQRARRRRHR